MFPSHDRYEYESGNEIESTGGDEYAFGSAFHTLLLEPHRMPEKYLIIPKMRRGTKEYNALKAQAEEQGLELLFETDKKIMDDMCISVKAHAQMQGMPERIFRDGYAESSMFWEDRESGLALKGRPDYHNDMYMIDVKTVRDGGANPKKFKWKMQDYGYDMQAALYLDGYTAITGREQKYYVFCCVEKSPPYVTKFIVLNNWQIVPEGRQKYEYAIKLYQHCKDKDEWPVYLENDLIVTGKLSHVRW